MTIGQVDWACYHYDKARDMRRELSKRFGRDIMDVHYDRFVIPEGVPYRKVATLMRKISYNERKAEEMLARKMGIKMKNVYMHEIEDCTYPR